MTQHVRLHWFGLKFAHEEARLLVRFCEQMISDDGLRVPAEQRSWRIGQTYSWHYVHIVDYRVKQLIEGIEAMAHKKGNNKNGSQNGFAGYEFVRCELTAEDKKAASVWIEENTTEFGPMLHDVVASDYKFSISFSSEHDTFTACLVGKEDNPINGKKTLTARHKDWVRASMTVLYKHSVIFKSGVWESASSTDDDGWA